MPITSGLNAVSSFLSNFLSTLLSFLKAVIGLPVFLASIFTNLPPIFAFGFSTVFSLIVICLVAKLYHILKG